MIPRHLLLAAILALFPAPVLADALTGSAPAPSVFITYGNPVSMDTTPVSGEVPDFPQVCDPQNVEYARTRHVIGLEALTGSLVDYCPVEQPRADTPGTRDDQEQIPHTAPTASRQRKDGLLDVYSDTLFFGLGTFDSIPDPSVDEAGDFSFGPALGAINLGLANKTAPIGGLVAPLPPAALPGVPGAVSSFRIHNNAVLQETVAGVIPGLGAPIAAALRDLGVVQQLAPSQASDPFAGCRDLVHVLVTDSDPLWDQCHDPRVDPPPFLQCSDYVQVYGLSTDEAVDLGERGVPTHVVAFAVNDPTEADELAAAGGTCALGDESGNCLQAAFRAESQAELLFSLGSIFNRTLSGDVSLVPPLASPVGVGLVRFRAGAEVSPVSPYWTGTLSRESFSCEPDAQGGPPDYTSGGLVQLESQYTPEFVPERRILTARLDVAAAGASCGNPTRPPQVPPPGDAPPEPSAPRGNDDPLPPTPPGVDFDAIEIGDTCLIPADPQTFVDDQDLTSYLYAETDDEARRTILFARGHSLQSIDDLGLLEGIFDPVTVALHDRPESGYVGDFYHTEMAFSSPPSALDRTTPGWQEFVQEVGVLADEPRPFVLFIGGNETMLHAFDAISGQELWAIIPPSFVPQLRRLVTGHILTVDGPVVVRDLLCAHVDGDEDWCSLLAVSYRGGGSGAMVLDVTDPRSPRFLFEVTGQQIPELGLGYTRPLLGNIFLDGAVRPVLVLSGGRPLEGPEAVVGGQMRGSHEGETIVVLDAITGRVVRQFDPVTHPGVFSSCGPVTGSPAGWSPERFTRLFAGTQNGCLLRVDTSSADPLDWTLDVLYQTTSPGEITHPPAIAPRADGTLVIVFGHGSSDDFEQVNQIGNLVSVNDAADATINFEVELAPGEFLTTQPVIADGVLFTSTWVPDPTDACAGGTARIYGIDLLGDSDIDGVDPDDACHVSVDSDRIVPRLDNPAFDPTDPDSEPLVKFLDGAPEVGEGAVGLGLPVEPLPSCEVLKSLLDSCGDGSRDAGEECDDSNRIDGDGCSRDCKCEASARTDQCCLGRPVDIAGTDGSDVIRVVEQGFLEGAVVAALGGDDTVLGSPGEDVICGGEGSDTLLGRRGDDVVAAGNGDDYVSGGRGADRLLGEAGDDVLSGGPGDDFVDGGDGGDTLSGGRGDDALLGGGAGDLLSAGLGSDCLDGGPGDTDICSGGAGADEATGCEVARRVEAQTATCDGTCPATGP